MAGGSSQKGKAGCIKDKLCWLHVFILAKPLTPMQPPSLKVSQPRSSHSIFWRDTKYSFVYLLSHKHFPVAALLQCHPSAQVESWGSAAHVSVSRCRFPFRLCDLHPHIWKLSWIYKKTLNSNNTNSFYGRNEKEGPYRNLIPVMGRNIRLRLSEDVQILLSSSFVFRVEADGVS